MESVLTASPGPCAKGRPREFCTDTALAAALRNHVPGVHDVRQRSYRQRRAELEVMMQGSAKSLADALARQSFPNFTLKIKSVGEGTVNGTLKR